MKKLFSKIILITLTLNIFSGTAQAFWNSPEDKQRYLAIKLLECSQKVEDSKVTDILCQVDDKDCKKESESTPSSFLEIVVGTNEELAKEMGDSKNSLQVRLRACSELVRRSEIKKKKENRERIDAQERNQTEELPDLSPIYDDCWGTGKSQEQ